MAGEHLPEDIIVKILSNLPVKSLVQFRCVSKRWRSIVSDPQFARLQFKVASEQQTVSRRILLSSGTTSQFESLDLETPSPQANSSRSIRRPHLPFRPGSRVSLLCSCNGLVCVALDSTESFYIWNPSIGFTHRLPDPFDSSKERLSHYGFGYVSATDDYKLVVGADAVDGLPGEVEVLEIFSLRARSWRRIEADPEDCIPECQGVLLNEALHWINMMGHWYALVDLDEDEVEVAEPFVIAFDLAREEFRNMPVPIIAKHNYGWTDVGVSSDGCLYVICSTQLESLEFWVMREYGDGDSWTKLFNLNTCEPPEQIMYLTPASAIVMLSTSSGLELVRIDHSEEKLGETSTVAARHMVPEHDMEMIGYEESLVWLSDYSLCAFAFWGLGM